MILYTMYKIIPTFAQIKPRIKSFLLIWSLHQSASTYGRLVGCFKGTARSSNVVSPIVIGTFTGWLFCSSIFCASSCSLAAYFSCSRFLSSGHPNRKIILYAMYRSNPTLAQIKPIQQRIKSFSLIWSLFSHRMNLTFQSE